MDEHQPSAAPSPWQRRTWVRGTRFYVGEIAHDLLGEWTFTRIWGATTSRKRGQKIMLCLSYADALRQLEKCAERRLKRGYENEKSC